MFEKILLVIIVSIAFLLYDTPKLKKTNRRDRIVYGMFMIPIMYLSLLYVMDLAWPNLDDIVHFFFLKPAQELIKIISFTM